jgi:NADH dehydrogenase (ubiquinone) 1 alpha subcomplex subunit 13
MSGYATFGIFAGVTTLAWVGYYFETKAMKRVYLEMNDARIAISPLLLAEEHRLFLKQLRANREEENELMKNVPGWETGKWKGEPVYHNLNNRFPVVHPEAYFAHTSWNEMYDRYFERRKH